MSKPLSTVPRVILAAPKTKKDLAPYAAEILTALTGNAHFPNPTPSLAVLAAAIATLTAAQAATLTRTKGAVTARNDAWMALLRILEHLRDYVQSVVEGDPVNALSMIESAAMKVRKRSIRKKAQLSVKQGAVSTTVILIARALAHGSVYYWEYSLDQKTWTSWADGLVATTQISGLTPGQTYYFRFRGLTRKGKTDYSPVASFMVK